MKNAQGNETRDIRDYVSYYQYCYQLLENIRPNRTFKLKLMSRIDWQNIVFCSQDTHSGEKIGIKIFLKVFGSRDRYLKDVYFSKLLSQDNKIAKSVDILYNQTFEYEEIEGALVQPWVCGTTWMNKIRSDFENFMNSDLIYLTDIFQDLWSCKINTTNDKEITLPSIFEADTYYPSLLNYKLGCSEESAFYSLYYRLPSLEDKITRLHHFYHDFRNENSQKCIVNGDPSAHELIFYDGYINWIDWEYVLYGYPMIDIAYMFYSLAHNFYNDGYKLKKLEQQYFHMFDINHDPMFIFYFIEKILMVEKATNARNDINILNWSINYANNFINETEG